MEIIFCFVFHITLFRFKYDPIFDTLNPVDGKISGTSAKGKDRQKFLKQKSQKQIFR